MNRIVFLSFCFGVVFLLLKTQADRRGDVHYFEEIFANFEESGTKRATIDGPCCFPDQMQGVVVDVAITEPHNVNTVKQLYLYLDSRNFRARFNFSMDVSQILLFNTTTNSADAYVFSFKQCNHFRIPNYSFNNAFLPCMTKDSIFTGKSTLGAGAGDSLAVNSWIMNAGGPNYWYSRMTSAENCVPVSALIFNSQQAFVDTMLFSNISLQPLDSSLFVPPANCTNVEGNFSKMKKLFGGFGF